MKKRLLIVFILMCWLPVVSYAKQLNNTIADSSGCPVIHACFTPPQNCLRQITEEILHAKKSVLVQAYSFSSEPIAKALVAAKKKGVDIKIILDKRQRKLYYSQFKLFQNAGIPVWFDTLRGIAHNKIMIIDGSHIITGSYNFTDAAENKNAENVVFIADPTLAQRYTDNWEYRKTESTRAEKIG